jgi:hypothetical protein
MTAVTFPLQHAAATPPAALRLGMTVSKRMARRAVDRNRVKRLIRESFRRTTAPLAGGLPGGGARIDVTVRLKRILPAPGAPGALPAAAWSRALRAEADQHFAALVARCRTEAAA